MTPRSSTDSFLSAFAQLGVLRFDTQRSTISLFGRYEEYILTEATRTLSLRDDNDYGTRDKLWVGACTISYERSFGTVIANTRIKSLSTKNLPYQVYIVPDLIKSDVYKNHPDVISYPSLRFLASAPIVSLKGIVISAYTILDDKPRQLFSPDYQKFLIDMAATIIDYLIINRLKTQYRRSERIIVGLGSFLEGKGSLRSSWVDTEDYTRELVLGDGIEGRIDAQQ